MLNDEDKEDNKATFGTSLERFRAGPTSTPSRYSHRLNRKRSIDAAIDATHVKKEVLDTTDTPTWLDDGLGPEIRVKKEESLSVASPGKPEGMQGLLHQPALSPDTSSSPLGTFRKPETPKRRKVYDDKQFEAMKGIPDRIGYDLDILFCGINPGVRSSEQGIHYAHPSNRFYRILHESGLTPHRLKPSESPEMPDRYRLGLTDLVLRCTARADQVPSMEFQAGATLLLRKMIQYRPKVVCFVGMDVYRQFRRHFAGVSGLMTPRKGKRSESSASNEMSPVSPVKGKQSGSDVQIGLQSLVISVTAEDSNAATPLRDYVRLFVIPSTSGLAAGYSDADRVGYLRNARDIVSAIRSGSTPTPDRAGNGEGVVIRAEDFLEEQIMKLASGDWAFVANSSKTASAR